MTLSIKTRFLLAAVCVTAFVLFYAGFTLKTEEATTALLRGTLSRNLASMHLAAEIKHGFVYYDDLTFRLLATGDTSLAQEGGKVRKKVKLMMSQLKGGSDSPIVRELISDLEAGSADYFKEIEKLLAAAPDPVVPGEKDSILKTILWARRVPKQQKAVGALSSEGKSKLTDIYALCDRLVDLNRIRMEDVQKRIDSQLDQNQLTTLWGGLFTLLGTAAIGLLLALSILVPLKDLLSGIQRIMGGDLDFEIVPKGDDEIGRITQAFNAMTRNIREKQQQLLTETITDALTGLYNFRYFQEALKTETERTRRYDKPLSVILMDIDHFKTYNDVNGHQMGNVALKTVAQAVKETLRPTDILARYGGEEFVAFLPETDSAQAHRVAERVREAIAGCEFPGEERLPGRKLTISLGGATFPHDTQVAKDLVEKADKALYQAKSLGRNRVQWTGAKAA